MCEERSFIQEVVLNGTNSLDVNVQDQHTRSFDRHFRKTLGAATLAVAIEPNDYSFTAAGGHGIVVGEHVTLYDSMTDIEFTAEVLTVVVNAIGLDAPASTDFAVATTTITRSTIELDVDGSVTRQTFAVTNLAVAPIDITRILLVIICDSAPTLATFGDLAALTRGVVVRVDNGEDYIVFNVKTNADLISMMIPDVTFFNAAGHGQDGLAGRLTFGGQDKHGVVIRLEQGDSLELIVQDNLTALNSFRFVAAGHVTSGE